MAEHDEDSDGGWLETAVFLVLLLSAAVALSFGWRIVSRALFDRTHAAQQQNAPSDIEAAHDASPNADHSDGS